MSNPPKAKRTEARRQSRVKAMQALYQHDIAGGEVADILTQFRETQEMGRVDMEYFDEVFRGVTSQIDEIDGLLTPYLDRKITDLDAVERSILHIAVFELKDRLDIPYRVVINESVELAKKFGAEAGHKYVNGVVDKLARDLRVAEVQAYSKGSK